MNNGRNRQTDHARNHDAGAFAPGTRVRLKPRRRADIFDLALRDKLATITSVELDHDNRVYLAVTVDDDPGGDLGISGNPGHRFFFTLDEVEPVSAKAGDGS